MEMPDSLTRIITKSAAAVPQDDPGAAAMQSAAELAKGPAGMPLLKLPDKKEGEGGEDAGKDAIRMAHELDSKSKEINGLRQQLQEAKFDTMRTQLKADIAQEQTKMRESLRKEQQQMHEKLRAEQKELDNRQSQLQIAEAQHKANNIAAEAEHKSKISIEQAQHKAQLDSDVSAHDAEIAQHKADSLMDIAKQTTDMYVKQTEKARSDADKYWQTQSEQFKANHPVISPALQSRLDGAMASVGRVGKSLQKMMADPMQGQVVKAAAPGQQQRPIPQAQGNQFRWNRAVSSEPFTGNDGKTWIREYSQDGGSVSYPQDQAETITIPEFGLSDEQKRQFKQYTGRDFTRNVNSDHYVYDGSGGFVNQDYQGVGGTINLPAPTSNSKLKENSGLGNANTVKPGAPKPTVDTKPKETAPISSAPAPKQMATFDPTHSDMSTALPEYHYSDPTEGNQGTSPYWFMEGLTPSNDSANKQPETSAPAQPAPQQEKQPEAPQSPAPAQPQAQPAQPQAQPGNYQVQPGQAAPDNETTKAFDDAAKTVNSGQVVEAGKAAPDRGTDTEKAFYEAAGRAATGQPITAPANTQAPTPIQQQSETTPPAQPGTKVADAVTPQQQPQQPKQPTWQEHLSNIVNDPLSEQWGAFTEVRNPNGGVDGYTASQDLAKWEIQNARLRNELVRLRDTGASEEQIKQYEDYFNKTQAITEGLRQRYSDIAKAAPGTYSAEDVALAKDNLTRSADLNDNEGQYHQGFLDMFRSGPSERYGSKIDQLQHQYEIQKEREGRGTIRKVYDWLLGDNLDHMYDMSNERVRRDNMLKRREVDPNVLHTWSSDYSNANRGTQDAINAVRGMGYNTTSAGDWGDNAWNGLNIGLGVMAPVGIGGAAGAAGKVGLTGAKMLAQQGLKATAKAGVGALGNSLRRMFPGFWRGLGNTIGLGFNGMYGYGMYDAARGGNTSYAAKDPYGYYTLHNPGTHQLPVGARKLPLMPQGLEDIDEPTGLAKNSSASTFLEKWAESPRRFVTQKAGEPWPQLRQPEVFMDPRLNQYKPADGKWTYESLTRARQQVAQQDYDNDPSKANAYKLNRYNQRVASLKNDATNAAGQQPQAQPQQQAPAQPAQPKQEPTPAPQQPAQPAQPPQPAQPSQPSQTPATPAPAVKQQEPAYTTPQLPTALKTQDDNRNSFQNDPYWLNKTKGGAYQSGILNFLSPFGQLLPLISNGLLPAITIHPSRQMLFNQTDRYDKMAFDANFMDAWHRLIPDRDYTTDMGRDAEVRWQRFNSVDPSKSTVS